MYNLKCNHLPYLNIHKYFKCFIKIVIKFLGNQNICCNHELSF